MAPLKNCRRESFALALAGGKSITDAYAAAGFKRDYDNARRLARNKEVKARVLELQTAVAEQTTKKRSDILAKLGEIIDVPVNVAEVKPRDQLKAAELYGKDIGMFGTDKQEVSGKIELHFSALEMKI